MKLTLAFGLLLLLVGCDNRNKKAKPEVGEQALPSPDMEQNSSLDRIPRRSNQANNFRSEEMLEALNSPPPSWLSVAPDVKPKRIDGPQDRPMGASMGMRPQGTGKSFVIAGKKIIFEFLISEITWLSVNPSNDRLVIERGAASEIRSILPDGTLSEPRDSLPALNFGSRKRWFLTRWEWMSDTELITAVNRPDDDGDIIVESQLLYYDSSRQRLAMISLPEDLIDYTDPYLEISQISDRSVKLHTLSREIWLEVPKALQ